MTLNAFSFSSSKQFPDWQNEFEAVLLEGDTGKLPPLMEAAEAAIFVRLQALTHGSDGHRERNAIEDALRTLRAFRTEKMHYPEISESNGIKLVPRKRGQR